MTRVVAGAAGGRTLRVPPGRETRPTSDRVREALFGRLDALGAVDGARVLDLYAGSGALGLEAASRGASSVVLVERARPALAALTANVRALALPGVRVVAAPVERYLAGPPEPVDLALLDPPYPLADDALAGVLDRLAAGWLAPGAVLVVERAARSPEPRWPDGVAGAGQRRYGETAVWFAEAGSRPAGE